MSNSLVSLWTEVRRQLEAAGVESPVFDARLLLEAGAGVSRMDIITDPRRLLSDAQVAAVQALAARRASREPLSYVLGRRSFWTLDLKVTADVLIPRPETEMLVEFALEVLPTQTPTRVLDLGVGSGAILLAILSERVHATGVGVDQSPAALTVARANMDALGLSSRVELVLGDWAEALEGGFDLVISNPPYIRSGDIADLAPEVRCEPRLALDGGGDGLAAYRTIVSQLPGMLRLGGAFAFEVGIGQADAVGELTRAAGLLVAPHRHDISGVARVVSGWEGG
jgi:release factor glutamine methyltransferase